MKTKEVASMPYPFTWVPAEQARHAGTDPTPAGHSYPTDTEVTTLCGQRRTADNGELAWLWPTCPHCYVAACHTVDAEIPAEYRTATRQAATR